MSISRTSRTTFEAVMASHDRGVGQAQDHANEVRRMKEGNGGPMLIMGAGA
jgi:hypothetical protein